MSESTERDTIKTLLGAICEDTATEAKWLNTLSLLEYIGARKISKTVAGRHPDSPEVLDHLADESRHAYAFKRLCVEISEGECDSYLCEDAAKRYFAELDQRATAWMNELTGEDDMSQNYLLVTTLIERRAMMMYPLYRSVTSHDVVRDELQEIVVEEQDHRVAIEENCVEMLSQYGVDGLEAVTDLEANLFAGFLDAVATELGVEVV